MKEDGQGLYFPEPIRRLISMVMTLVAIILYAGILGSAIFQTLSQPSTPRFSQHMVRAAGILGGLVGTVVTAGFARSAKPVSSQMSTEHPLGGQALTAWSNLKPPSLFVRNLLGLADTLGFIAKPSSLSRAIEPGEEVQAPSFEITLSVWMGLIYFAVYFLIGGAALVVTLVKQSNTPDLIANTGWVWLGTLATNTYAFFGLDTQG